MHITEDSAQGNVITSYEKGKITVNEIEHTTSLLLTTDTLVEMPEANLENLFSESFMQSLRKLKVEILILGTGIFQRFPEPDIYGLFASHKIGFEVMHTSAACRTFNVLVSEKRKVAGILLIET